MDRCEEIIANVKMEECYSGLSLTYEDNEALKAEISEAIDKVSTDTNMTPVVFENSKNTQEGKPAFYVEFSDEVQRDSGDFFELLLKELKIDKCAHDVIIDKSKGTKC